MLQSDTLSFLKKLKINNNKDWFEANRQTYTTARQNVEEFVVEILKGLQKTDVGFGSLSPKSCMFRINRDVRFSKDKSPYKTNMGVYFNPAGKAVHTPGYYMHIEPGKCFAASGIWMPEAKELAKIRQEIDYNFDEFTSVVGNKAFLKIFSSGLATDEKLTRPPKGYSEDNPAIEFLKLKSFVVMKSITDDEVVDSKFPAKLVKIFEQATPFNRFLERALD